MSYGIEYRPPKNTLPSFNDQLFTPIDNSVATENLVINIEDANTNQNTTISANNSLIDAFTSSFLFQSYTLLTETLVPNSTTRPVRDNTGAPISFVGEVGKTYMININGSCNTTTYLMSIQLILTNGAEVQYLYQIPLTGAIPTDTIGPQVFSFSKVFLTTGTGSTVSLSYFVRCNTTTTIFSTPVAFNSSANYTTPTVTILTL